VTQHKRLIGKFKGEENGTLVIFTAAMHGNEGAGVDGLVRFFRYLEQQATNETNPWVKGRIIGLMGNMHAYQEGKRYISKDMNRCWLPTEIKRITEASSYSLQDEDLEIRQLLDILLPEIFGIKRMFLLDLHTTSSEGGIFCIAGQNRKDIHLAHAMGVPVVLGLLDGLEGTTLQFFESAFTGVDTIAIAFEAGHHDDPLSIDRSFEACRRFLQVTGCTETSENDGFIKLGTEKSENLVPQILKVTYRQSVEKNEAWSMRPGYHNFQKVAAGEKLALYEGEDIMSPVEGYLLMPLYQAQGKDGFFVAEEWRIE
jgi:succinylglutamate desuccinylase